MRSIWRTFSFLGTHPLAKKHKTKTFLRFLKWQIGSWLNPYPLVFPFVENSRLLVSKGMTGATGNVYTGLHEFNDMGFLLHFLRESDVFVDIGANVGSYTVLASSVVGAHTIAIEPVPSTFIHLKNNACVNQIEELVSLNNIGLGSTSDTIFFTSGLDTVNHVVTKGEAVKDAIKVNVKTLDNTLKGKAPSLIKIDVEGYEKFVLEGAIHTLNNPALNAIIIELNGSGDRYGIDEHEIHQQLLSLGFQPYDYDPFSRVLTKLGCFGSYNTIYIREEEYVLERVQAARKFNILGSKI
ncbi:FkbM family methyltransferase [Catalinimonas alkaloidigena]|uniref:FkbM family methyltransferase n=1 Tax=Catalinimonas alkaloidigena TaxID=1075417 RepID=UPI0024076B5C|nr:FkbM family methyltransferase [Catalinimonas alkaloidigena]MDF9798351.1 FkbM family methyltransferase [Catalinimonas alkaloidigena]